MILADIDILKLIHTKEIVVTDFRRENLRPNGVRLHLSKELIILNHNQLIDLRYSEDVAHSKIEIDEEEGFVLAPDDFVLVATKEKIKTPRNVVGYIEGRSTIARLGLAIHCTSGLVDNLYEEPRAIVLEMKNTGPVPIKLYPNVPIGMLIFHQLTNSVVQKAQAQYRGQTEVTGPNLKFNRISGGQYEQ